MAKLPCPSELWPAFSVLLDEALDLPESDRPKWLASLGPEHAAVRPWLFKVITGGPGTLETDFMKAVVIDEPTSSEFFPGQQIGPYLLKKRLGSGGMGDVWLASRSDGTLNRQVALKLPHTHLMAGVLRRRFERERDILAGLSHPHIAQLYDAGVADSQHPYLAMEWVDGVSINQHCRDAKVSLERRLDLFLQILDAVGYAHERLVAHRDIKPSNILVTRDGQVKLLDFGIAKLLVGDTEIGATQLTRVGSCIATPGYAAPEQLKGEPITAAVDLYALGVVLRELLTGQRPHRDKRKPPVEPGTAARASSQIEDGHAEQVGGLETKQLRRALSGDLDAIIAKALEVDPAHRYRSAESFAQDIELSRQNRPISARHISPATLALKFMRRHWVGVAMTTSLLLALIGGSAGIAWQAVRAEREAQRATTIKDFLVGVFRASDPRIAADKPRGEITARELLDISSQQIESAFAQQPETQIELLGVTADIYRELDETQRSTALYAREIELADKHLGAADTRAIDGLLGQAYNADADGDDKRALALLAQADPLIRQAHLDKTAVRARWLLMHGEALYRDSAKGEDAQSSLEAAAALFKTVAPQDPHYPDALTDLGSLSLDRSQFSSSANYYRQAIAVAEPNRQVEGDVLLANQGLALALKYLGDAEGAAAAFEHGTTIAARTYGLDSHHYWMIASDWAQFRYERGERQAALAAFETLVQSLPKEKASFRNANDALEAALVLRKYGRCLANDGQGAQSINLLEQARTLLKKSAMHPPDAGLLQIDLGSAYQAGGRNAEAREAFLNAIRTLEAQQAPVSWLASAHERWGRFLLSQSDARSAVTEFDDALRLSEGHVIPAAVFAQAGLAAIAVLRNDARAALNFSGRSMIQLDRIEEFYDIRIRPYVWGIRAQSLQLAGDQEGARALAKRSRDAAILYYAPGSAAVTQAEALFKSTTSNVTAR
jgi:serine/threonine protein kinase/tetratricopeptide (TPR) repeat protein